MQSVPFSPVASSCTHTSNLVSSTLRKILLAVVLSAAAMVPAFAADAVPLTQCILGQPGAPASLNCDNASDVLLSTPTVTIVKGCDYPGDYAELNVTVDVYGVAAKTYDLGVWISVDGDPNNDGSATGQCAVLTMPNDVLHVDGTTSTYGDGDACGDVFDVGAAKPDPDILGVDMGTVFYLCEDTDGDGNINVPTILTWRSSPGSACTVSNEALPSAGSKCYESFDTNLDVPVPGRIIVTKDTIPDNPPQSFDFTLNGPDSGIAGGFTGTHPFSLTDDGITPEDAIFDSGDGTFTGGLPATNESPDFYSVTETPLDGWVQGVTCSSDLDELNTNPANIDLRPGETVTCDFVNVEAVGDLTVRKQSVGGFGSFGFGVTDNAAFSTINTLVTAADNNPADWVQTVDIGIYEITEAIPAGWVLTSATCTGNLTQVSPPVVDLVAGTVTGVVVAPGEDVVCTFVDAALGSLSVTKTAVGGDDTFSFSHDIDGGDTFDLGTSNGSATSGAITNVAAGIYQISETVVPDGWDLVSATCVNQDLTVVDTATVVPNGVEFVQLDGQTTSCEFVNVKLGTIVIEKVTDPAPNTTDSFTFDSDPALGISTFALMNGGTETILDVPVDVDGSTRIAYTISEQDPTPTFDLTGLECVTVPELLINPHVTDLGARSATINIAAGETVTCTFTNTERAAITVEKVLSGDFGDLSTSFAFTSDFDAPFNLDPVNTPAQEVFTGLAPGVPYMVSETLPHDQGWALIGATCNVAGETVNLGTGMISNIVPQAGDDITCTFTNAPLGSATIVKNAVGGDGVFHFFGTLEPFNNAGAGFEIDTSVTSTVDFTNMLLPSEIYDVQEDIVPPNWRLTDILCVDATGDSVPLGTEDPPHDPALGAFIQAAVEETVTCTFTNEADATLTVSKVTVPATDTTTEFVFTGTGDINGPLVGGGSLSTMGPQGTFVADETPTAGWALTDIFCDGVSSEQISYGGTGSFAPGDTDVSINLAPGEAADCTYTNTKLGSITLRKVTVGDMGAFSFTGTDVDNDAGIIVGPFSLSTDPADAPLTDEVMFSGLLPGQYLFSETPVPGWEIDGTAGDIVCTGQTSSNVVPGTNSLDITLLAGEDLVCTFTNTRQVTLIVEKMTDPVSSTQAFTFTGDVAGSAQHGETITAQNLTPGTYTSTETAVPGWDITGISCDDTDSTGNTDTGVATFIAGAGEIIKCTFTNVIQRGKIIVDKQTAPAESAQLFDFTLTGSGVSVPFQLADLTTPFDSGDLLPTSENGPYSVLEGTLPDDWNSVSATCDDQSDPAAIDLAPGETVTCTFVNAQEGQSTFTKVSVGGDATFNFSNTAPSGAFSLTTVDGISPVESIADLTAGQYTIVEQELAGWVLTDIQCTESDAQDSVVDIPNRTITLNVQEGETINCTVTNTKNGSITVAKTTVPAAAPDLFVFTGDAAGTIADGGTIVVPDLVPGAYTSVEGALAGWDLTDITCDDGVSTTPSTGDVGTRTATFNLDPGENVICTFTNTIQYGEIIVDKVTLPAASPQAFDFTLTGGVDTNVNFSLMDMSVAFNSGDLIPTSHSATYSVVEAAVDDWDNTSIVCTGSEGAENPTAIDLGPDETVTCVFTNTQRSDLTIIKTTVGGDDTFNFASVALGNFDLTTVAGTAQASYPDLVPGVYDVVETGWPAGWTPVPAICDDGSTGDAIGVDPGQSVTCEFVNLAPGDLIITVESVGLPDQEFCFDVFNRETDAHLGQFCVTTVNGIAQVEANALPVGPYRIEEVPNDIYTLEEFVCDNGAQNDLLVLDPGDRITCPFRVVPRLPDIPVPASNAWTLSLLTLMMLATGWYFRPVRTRRF